MTVLTFLVKKKYSEAFRGVFCENTRENFKLNLVLVLVPKFKALYYLKVDQPCSFVGTHFVFQFFTSIVIRGDWL